jgi:hypothetical protein
MDHPPRRIDGSIERRALMPRDVILPPPEPGVRYVRVPLRYVLVVADDPLRDRVDRFFHWPMIILALFMLPLLAWEFLAPPLWGTWQWWASASGLAIIWTAFFVEFLVKIAIAESRLEYVKRNWLDVLILALPLLRPLRISYLARTSRVFTLRGVGMKCLRYVATILVGLEATDRMLERLGVKVKKGRQDPRTMTRHELMSEVTKLRRLADRWNEWYELHGDHVKRHGTCVPFRQPRPCEDPIAGSEITQAPEATCEIRSATDVPRLRLVPDAEGVLPQTSDSTPSSTNRDAVDAG